MLTATEKASSSSALQHLVLSAGRRSSPIVAGSGERFALLPPACSLRPTSFQLLSLLPVDRQATDTLHRAIRARRPTMLDGGYVLIMLAKGCRSLLRHVVGLVHAHVTLNLAQGAYAATSTAPTPAAGPPAVVTSMLFIAVIPNGWRRNRPDRQTKPPSQLRCCWRAATRNSNEHPQDRQHPAYLRCKAAVPMTSSTPNSNAEMRQNAPGPRVCGMISNRSTSAGCVTGW